MNARGGLPKMYTEEGAHRRKEKCLRVISIARNRIISSDLIKELYI